MTTDINYRNATLATGEIVPLIPAARALARLQNQLDLPDAEWDVVYYLRELCLGRTIEPEQRRTMVQEGLLAADGEVDPTLRAVVLAAVRGSGRVLHLDSPFVEREDQTRAEFATSRDYLEATLSADAFRQLLAGDGVLDQLRQAANELPLPPQLEDAAGFARRIRERAAEKTADSPGGPSAPSP